MWQIKIKGVWFKTHFLKNCCNSIFLKPFTPKWKVFTVKKHHDHNQLIINNITHKN